MNRPSVVSPFSSTASHNAVAQSDNNKAIAEVQAAMMIARMNPRDPVAAMDRILNACTRPTLANSAVYSYAKGGAEVTGPSIRLAEAMAQSWGNIQYGIRELEQRDGESTVQAFAWDIETNTRREVTFQVPHARFAGGKLKPLSDPRDIYEMVANQGARRLRACILSIIPGDVSEAAVNQCEVTINASADTSPEGIAKMLSVFERYGVNREQIKKRIQCNIEAIRPAQVVSLLKIACSLRDGMSSVADWFEVAEHKTSKAKELNSSLEAISDAQAAELRELISSVGITEQQFCESPEINISSLNELRAALFVSAKNWLNQFRSEQ